MTTQLKSIATPYDNIWFRSRLEARWAVFFSTIELQWCYEPQGFKLPDGTNYLPDFWLPTINAYLEVKGFWNDTLMKAFRFGSLLIDQTLYIAVGDIPTLQHLVVHGWSSDRYGTGVLRASNGPEWETWFPPSHPLVRKGIIAARAERFDPPSLAA